MTEIAGGSLFEEVARLTGLSGFLAPGAVRRALEEAGVDPASARREDYIKILDSLERRMKIYLPPQTAEERMADIERLVQGWAKP